MIDEDDSAQADAQAAPAPEPPQGGFFSRIDAERVLAAVENWYALHFHKAALAGRQPISADDKALLIQHVATALTPAKE